MRRISSNLTNDDFQFHLRRRESELNRTQNQVGTNQRIQDLRDDPVAAAHGTRYQSYLSRIDQYAKNTQYAQSHLRYAEGFLNEANSLLHRMSELAIQGSNGTYSVSDLKAMGVEVNQLINELVSLANSKSPDGGPLFAGDKAMGEAFRVLTGRVPGSDEALITQVDYLGTLGGREVDIAENARVDIGLKGNTLFWAEQQSIFSGVDVQDFQVPADTTIRIDGTDIALKAGDTAGVVIERINSADLAVRARLDPVTNGLVLETTMPHQIWLEEGPGSTVLQDLGLIADNELRPPHNLNPDARRFGGSLFDVAIQFRDALLEGNQGALGTRSLAGLRAAQDNLLARMADLGAKDGRLDESTKRLAFESATLTGQASQLLDLDLAQGVTELKMLESVHKASLGAAGRILTPRLMDFLR